MWRRTIKFIKWSSITLLAIVTLGIVGAFAYEIYYRPQMVANILKIKSPPSSLEVIDCESPITSDILTTCVIKIAPRNFKELLAGYVFEEHAIQGSSHSVVGPKLGVEFLVSTQYFAEPKEFEHGGSVIVFANAARDMAVVDLYIE